EVVAKDVEHVELEAHPRAQLLLAEQVARVELPADAEALLRADGGEEHRERHARADLEPVVEVPAGVDGRRQPGGELVIREAHRRSDLDAHVVIRELRVGRCRGQQAENQQRSHGRVLGGLRTREATGTRTAWGSTTTGIALNA